MTGEAVVHPGLVGLRDDPQITVVGIDPGLVHTGLVRFHIDPLARRYIVDYAIAEGRADQTGPDIASVAYWWDQKPADHTYVEAYKPRSAFVTDAEMGRIVNELRVAFPKGRTILNTGSKQVIRRPLMELLDVWKFELRSNHQDLRAAARIGLYGMLKNPEQNEVLYTFVTEQLDGTHWDKEIINGGYTKDTVVQLGRPQRDARENS